MYMHKDCKINPKIKILIKNPNPKTYFYQIIHLYFTSYKDKFKKIKTKNHVKNNLNVYTYTKINK